MESIGRLVDEGSNGAIHVTSQPSSDSDDGDGDTLVELSAGRIDIAVIRTARLSIAGVSTFQALQAPFVIDNEVLAERVAADPITTEMMKGLDKLGVVGLAIAPSGLRHPIGYNKPLVSLADYKGATINTRPGLEVDQLFSALGATTDHHVGGTRLAAVKDGSLTGIELSLWQDVGIYPATLTSNVTFYSKFDVVLVNKKVYDGLSKAQREALKAAVTKAIPATIATRQVETAAAAKWCETAGNSVVRATPADIAAIQQATAPVLSQLESDPFTKKVIDRIHDLSAGTTPVDLPSCENSSTTDDVMIQPKGDQSVIDGTWRLEISYENLAAVAPPSAHPESDAGVWTLVFNGGKGTAKGGKGVDCGVAYFIDGDRISVSFEADPTKDCGGLVAGTFKRDGDTLTMNFTEDAVSSDLAYSNAFVSNGLHRVGDAP